MAATLPEDTLLFNLDAIVSNQYGTANVRLLANASTPIRTNADPDDYDESTFDGYTPIDLDDWGAAVLVDDVYAQKTHPQIVFTFTGVAGTAVVYGYIVVNQTGDKVMSGQYFTSPITLTTTNRNLPIDFFLQLLG